MKIPMALSVTSSQREQTSLRSQAPRLPRSNVCSTRDLENPSASVHLKRFSTPSLTLKFLCAGKLNPRRVPRLFRAGLLESFISMASLISEGVCPEAQRNLAQHFVIFQDARVK